MSLIHYPHLWNKYLKLRFRYHLCDVDDINFCVKVDYEDP